MPYPVAEKQLAWNTLAIQAILQFGPLKKLPGKEIPFGYSEADTALVGICKTPHEMDTTSWFVPLTQKTHLPVIFPKIQSY